MKSIIIAIVAAVSFTYGYAKGETVTQKAIAGAETLAAKAITDGNLTAAKGWSEVATNLRLGMYIAPFGDLASQFSGQVKNLPAFIKASTEVEAAKPITEWYQNPFSSVAVSEVLANNPEGFKRGLVQSAIWSAVSFPGTWDVREEGQKKLMDAMSKGTTKEEAKAIEDANKKAEEIAEKLAKPTPVQFEALKSWIIAGCPTTKDEFIVQISTQTKAAIKLAPLIPLLNEGGKVAAK
jgi:hypothetical protein